jgi:hypothetical protein
MTQALINNSELFDDKSLQYVSLSLGDVKLLVLRSDIISLESMQDIDYEKPSQNSIGWLIYENQKIPVYYFTEQLGIECSISVNKNVCAVLKGEGCYISVMCLEAKPFKQIIIKTNQLPECMQSVPSPIDTLCLYQNNNKRDINFIISATSLVKYINEYEDL